MKTKLKSTKEILNEFKDLKGYEDTLLLHLIAGFLPKNSRFEKSLQYLIDTADEEYLIELNNAILNGDRNRLVYLINNLDAFSPKFKRLTLKIHLYTSTPLFDILTLSTEANLFFLVFILNTPLIQLLLGISEQKGSKLATLLAKEEFNFNALCSFLTESAELNDNDKDIDKVLNEASYIRDKRIEFNQVLTELKTLEKNETAN